MGEARVQLEVAPPLCAFPFKNSVRFRPKELEGCSLLMLLLGGHGGDLKKSTYVEHNEAW